MKVELVGLIASECPHCGEKEVVCFPVEGSPQQIPQRMRCSCCKAEFTVQEYFDVTIELPTREQ